MSEKVQTKVWLPEEVKDLLDASPRSNSQLATDAILAEMHSREKASLERRIEECDRRYAELKTQRNERQREMEEVLSERERYEKQLHKIGERKQQQAGVIIHEFVQNFPEDFPLDPDEPTIKAKADSAEMAPDEFVQAVREARQ